MNTDSTAPMSAEEVLEKHFFNYLRPSFPSDGRTKEVLKTYRALKEEWQATLDAMEEYASQFKAPVTPTNVGEQEGSREEVPVIFGVKKGLGDEWSATFTIGVQTFTLRENGDKEHAEWYCKMLRKAFENFPRMVLSSTSPVHEGRDESEAFLLHLIDVAWNECTQSTEVPDTVWSRVMIEKARSTFKGSTSTSMDDKRAEEGQNNTLNQ